MFVVPDEEDLTLVHALITGPFDTPYEGGFFYFTIRCPPNYPIQSPRVRLMTTGGGTVRFNPNLYKSGKVRMKYSYLKYIFFTCVSFEKELMEIF